MYVFLYLCIDFVIVRYLVVSSCLSCVLYLFSSFVMSFSIYVGIALFRRVGFISSFREACLYVVVSLCLPFFHIPFLLPSLFHYFVSSFVRSVVCYVFISCCRSVGISLCCSFVMSFVTSFCLSCVWSLCMYVVISLGSEFFIYVCLYFRTHVSISVFLSFCS